MNNRQRILSTFFDIIVLLFLGAFIAWEWTLVVTSSDPFTGAWLFLPLSFIPLVIAFPIFFVKFIKLAYAIYLHKATKELKTDTGLKIFSYGNGYIFAIIVQYIMYITLVPSHLDVVAVYMEPITKSIDAVVNKTRIAPQDITPMLNLITNPTDEDKLFFVQGISFERHTLKSLYDPEYFYDNNRYVLAFDVSFAFPEMSIHYCYNSTIKSWISYGYPDGDRNVLDTLKTATTMKSMRYRLEDGHYNPEIINVPHSCACCN